MTCCFRAGEVLVLPSKGGADSLELDIDPDLTYCAKTLLRIFMEARRDHQEPREDAFDLLAGFRAQPFVLRVREGTEIHTANALRRNARVAAAVPNFILRAMSGSGDASFMIEDTRIDSLALSVRRAPVGRPSRVAIIDTGVEPTRLRNPLSIAPVQYDVETPRVEEAPNDGEGHGTIVARIIETIAPGSSVLSVKALPNGTLAGVLMAIQIAISTFKPHVVNLSLGIDNVSQYCPQCGYPVGQQFPEAQFRTFFDALDDNQLIEPPAYVAAAGNRNTIALPARCSTTIAVGSFDSLAGSCSLYASYPKVPADRFIMADGGSKSSSFGKSGKGEVFFGTSFSAAMISAIAGNFGAAHSCPLTMRECILRHLSRFADKGIPKYDPHLHGLGVVRTS
jgi:hypothetical protein